MASRLTAEGLVEPGAAHPAERSHDLGQPRQGEVAVGVVGE